MSASTKTPAEPPAVANLSNAQTATKSTATEQNIDPWSVSAGIDEDGNALAFDYEAISRKWNTNLISEELLQRFEKLTGHKPHRWLRRGLYFSHRDFDRILTAYERGDRFMLYTGRGPSSGSLHIGHTIPFEFTKWLQDVFDVPLVIMLTDDEKFLFKDGLSVEDTYKFALENAKDILAVGFDEKKTFIFSDFGYMGGPFYANAIEFSRALTTNQVRGAFGFDGSTNIGRVFFPAVQCVAAFATSFPDIWGESPTAPRQKKTAQIPCLIPCAIDQDPYFRILRENCHKMKYPVPKPALIHCKFLTALQGAGGKMSASDPNSAVFMSDTKNQIKKKINSHAFSGGRETAEEQRQLGGNPDVDVSYQYLTYFLDDDQELAQIYSSYKSGAMLTGELKQKCIAVMQEYVDGFQARRAKIDDATLKRYMTPRKLDWKGNPNPNKDAKHPQAASSTGTTAVAGASAATGAAMGAGVAAAAATHTSSKTESAATVPSTPPQSAQQNESTSLKDKIKGFAHKVTHSTSEADQKKATSSSSDKAAPAAASNPAPPTTTSSAIPSQQTQQSSSQATGGAGLLPGFNEQEAANHHTGDGKHDEYDDDQEATDSMPPLLRTRTGQDSPSVEKRPQRPGMPQKESTTYGVSGLSTYGDSLSELVYPTRKKLAQQQQ